GRLGGVVARGQFIVTTPNADRLFEPQLSQCQVQMRADYRFGPDDHLLYPQPFNEKLCYLSAIPHCPKDSADPLSLFWDNPNYSKF
ncbi:hypothetical protein C8J56DRAFT_751391, partial [Mycena floridula]